MSMRFTNKDFWNQSDVIMSQDKLTLPKLYFYEAVLLEKVPFDHRAKLRIQVFGCGTGREIPGILEIFPNAEIIASDIADKMIEKCRHNIGKWGLGDKPIKLIVSPSEEVDEPAGSSDIVTIMNNMLTYVTPISARMKVFENAGRILRENGYVIGVVHHRYGKPLKTLYFLFQVLIQWMPGVRLGDRLGGFFGKRIRFHYFSKGEVRMLLEGTGFQPVLITDLKGLYASFGKNYSRWRGDNNIVFIGRKTK